LLGHSACISIAATAGKERTHPPPRNGPTLPVFRNQEGTGLETHLFRYPFSLSIIVFSASKRRKRWEKTGSLTNGHAEYAGNGLARILALVIARRHVGKKSAKGNGMPKNVLSGTKRTAHIFKPFT